MDKRLFNRYDIRHEIAKGNEGILYRARDRQANADVVVKVIEPGLKDPELFYQALREEVTPLLSLRHDNIIPYVDFQFYEGQSILISGYVEGSTLKDVLHDYPDGIPAGEVVNIIGSLANALTYLQEHHLVHQQVTPENVLLQVGDNRPFLIDHYLPSLGEYHELPSNVAYLSPEQSAAEAVDHTTDIYALGILAYALLCGHRPFKGDSSGAASLPSVVQRIQWEHQNAPVPPISKLRPDLPEALDAVFALALAKTPGMRYQNALDFFYDLKNALLTTKTDLSTTTLTVRPPIREALGRQDRSRMTCLLQIAIFALVGGGLIYLASTFGQSLIDPVLQVVNVPTNTRTFTLTPTTISTITPLPSIVPSNTSTPTLTATSTSTPTRFPTSTQRPSLTPSSSPTPVFTATQATNTPTRFPTSTQRPTLEPTMTPTPVELAAFGLGTTPINVRSAPDLTSDVVGILRPNTPITVLARDASSSWVRIRFADAPNAWVSATLVSLTREQIARLSVSS